MVTHTKKINNVQNWGWELTNQDYISAFSHAEHLLLPHFLSCKKKKKNLLKIQVFRCLNLDPGAQLKTSTSEIFIQSLYKKHLRKLILEKMCFVLFCFFFEPNLEYFETLFLILKRICSKVPYENNIYFILILILKYSWALLENPEHNFARFLCQKIAKRDKWIALHHSFSLVIWEQPTMKDVIYFKMLGNCLTE